MPAKFMVNQCNPWPQSFGVIPKEFFFSKKALYPMMQVSQTHEQYSQSGWNKSAEQA